MNEQLSQRAVSRGISLTALRNAALALITRILLAATSVSFAESYRGLYLWAVHHGITGLWAAVWPLQVDVFVAVGELALVVGLADRWTPRQRGGAWAVTLLGLAVSVAGNVGHVAGHDLASRATAAVPPLAAAAALAVGLGVLKRVVAGQAETAAIASGTEAAPAAIARASAGQAATAPNLAGQSRHRRRGKRKLTTMTAADQDAAVLAALQQNPAISKAALARTVGVSPRTAARALARVSGGSALNGQQADYHTEHEER